MNRRTTTVRGLAVATAALLLAACMNHPPPPRHPGPYKDPVDAFNATAVPRAPGRPSGHNQPLSDDLGQLRDARQAYEHSQTVQAARTRDQQQKCRKDPDARIVHIQDGTDDPEAVYCQRPATESEHGGS